MLAYVFDRKLAILVGRLSVLTGFCPVSCCYRKPCTYILIRSFHTGLTFMCATHCNRKCNRNDAACTYVYVPVHACKRNARVDKLSTLVCGVISIALNYSCNVQCNAHIQCESGYPLSKLYSLDYLLHTKKKV